LRALVDSEKYTSILTQCHDSQLAEPVILFTHSENVFHQNMKTKLKATESNPNSTMLMPGSKPKAM
jgi:hypothetical protein